GARPFAKDGNTERAEAIDGLAMTELEDLERHGPLLADAGHAFRRVADDDEALRCVRDDLLAREGAARALRQGPVVGDLVGAVHRHVDLPRSFIAEQRDAELARVTTRRLRRAHAG